MTNETPKQIKEWNEAPFEFKHIAPGRRSSPISKDGLLEFYDRNRREFVKVSTGFLTPTEISPFMDLIDSYHIARQYGTRRGIEYYITGKMADLRETIKMARCTTPKWGI